MKLFLASNSGTAKTKNILMLERAAETAVENTDFEVFIIFDGKKQELNVPEQVTVIEHRHRCYHTLTNSSRKDDGDFAMIASSTFLRTEIAYLCKKLGFEDEYVLYTDYDVLFQKGDYSDLLDLKPEILASAPEFEKDNWSYTNCGVMLVNVNYFWENDKFIMDYINSDFEGFTVFDQSMYNNLYAGKVTKLPLEYNWKTYWGINPSAKIIHFHGAKPYIITPDYSHLPEIENIKNMDLPSYNHYSKIFANGRDS